MSRLVGARPSLEGAIVNNSLVDNTIDLVDYSSVPTREQRAQQIRQFILDTADQESAKVATIAGRRFGISRQAINRHIGALVDQGLLIRTGQTRGVRYRRAVQKVKFTVPVEGLSEHNVWDERVASLTEGLPGNVLGIGFYGFTEMVNNVIDHSGSTEVTLAVERAPATLTMVIQDQGIGIFTKLKESLELEDERHAVFELTKGKLTTDPKRHTGEGIFFTSRMFDKFGLGSGELLLGRMRDGRDWLVNDIDRSVQGTNVYLEIGTDSTHTTQEIFDNYTSEQDDYGFNKTHVLVELAKAGEESFVSRSQAKRIVARLDKFKEVVLDFSNVEDIGPAFADEMFRVFATRHPSINLIPISTNENVSRMIRRAEQDSKS